MPLLSEIALIPVNPMICAKCGETMDQTEKDTSSGRDIREYKCSRCGYSDWEDRGDALWKILHDDREEFEASRITPTDRKSTRLNSSHLGISYAVFCLKK